jgi:hypothetical protein
VDITYLCIMNDYQNMTLKNTLYSGLRYIVYKYTQIYFVNEKFHTKTLMVITVSLHAAAQ